jgi:epsilon-lactone hydrolase
MEEIKAVEIGWRSHLRVRMMRLFFRPVVGLLARMSEERLMTVQLKAAVGDRQVEGMSCGFDIINGVPCSIVGERNERSNLAILYLHGGAFVFPASHRQLSLLARLCKDLKAIGFMPDYRLAPQHPAPAALDDCERAYAGLAQYGYSPDRIVIVGESAGGNLTLGLLQRIRKAGLAMPVCAVPISPVTELARIHALPSRVFNAALDALLPPLLFARAMGWYTRGQDATAPEISPLYADYTGFPPLYFLAGASESLRDDSVFAAKRAREAGVQSELSLWPVLPHAFPIFEDMFAEACQARQDMVAFIMTHASRRRAAA